MTNLILTKCRYRDTMLEHQGMPSAYRGVEQLVARRAHNPEVVGSSPASATIKTTAFAVVFLCFYNFLRQNGIYQNSFDTNFDTNAESELVLCVLCRDSV